MRPQVLQSWRLNWLIWSTLSDERRFMKSLLELIALAVGLGVWIQYDYNSAGVVSFLLFIIFAITVLTGYGLPRFKGRGKALVAVLITGTYMSIAGDSMNKETEALLANLKTTDETAYLAKLKEHDENRWFRELSRMDPEAHALEIAARDAKADRERLAACSSGKEVMAYVMMQDAVKDRLKAPATAKFPARMGKGTKHLGDCIFRVRGTFDAQNGFGALIRGSFEGEIKYFPEEGTWLALDLSVNG
jgi:hypothetical protein